MLLDSLDDIKLMLTFFMEKFISYSFLYFLHLFYNRKSMDNEKMDK